MHTVVIVALPDTVAFDITVPVEVFGRVRLDTGEPAYRVLVCGPEPEVDAGPFRIVTDRGLEALEQADTIVVPGCNDVHTAPSDATAAALRAAFTRGARIVSICSGAFIVAATGLLDGRRATTHWAGTDAFRSLYPKVLLDPDVLYVDEGQILTSAGAAAGIDLCLHLVSRDFGAAVAARTARLSVVPLHRRGGQAQFIVRNPAPAAHFGARHGLDDVLGWIEVNAHRDLTLDEIAHQAAMSVRTLNRRFRAGTGQTPVQWVIGVRVRHAQQLLETSDLGVESIGRRVGFTSPANFREQFRRLTGVPPRRYRESFRDPLAG